MALTYDPEKDFYKLLGLSGATGITEQAVRRAYLECARKAHPDRDRTNNAATGNFQDIQQAYEVLKDDTKRAKYDRLRLDGIRREETRKREEAARKRADEGWGRGANRRRQGGQGTQQYGPEKYYPFDQRMPKPPAAPKPSNAYSAWAEMGRANGTGKFGPSAYQAHAQKQTGDTKTRPGPHPTAKVPKKPASQRPGSFAQGGWAKDGPSGTESPGKNGYRPSSSTMGDEPRAKSNSYSSNSRPKPFAGGYDASDEADSDNVEAILKDRRSQPYQSVHGEKTKVFTPGVKETSSDESRGRKPPFTQPAEPRQEAKLNGQDPWTASTTPQAFSFKPPNGQGVNTPGHESDRPSVFKTATENPASWFKPPDTAFAFTAGSSTPQPPLRKTRSSGIVGRKQSPVKRTRPPSTPAPKQAPDRVDSESPSKFDANEWLSGPNDWKEKVAPQNPPNRTNPRAPSVSPARQPQTRSTLKRAATTSRPTSTTPRAATVEDVSDSKGAPVTGHHRAKETRSVPMDSPTAMDIDSPSPPQPVPAQVPEPAQTPSQPPRTRGVPVEPTKPEWRHGNAGESSKAKKRSSADRTRPVKPAAGGSEDTDEFHEILKDIKNVYPIAPQATGLSSVNDLKANLPFTSQPSESIPVSKAPEKKVKSLTIPEPPVAPMFPKGVKPTPDFAVGHRQQFDAYRKQWTHYNMIMVDHFRSRQAQIAAAAAARAQQGQSKGDAGSHRAALAQEVEWMRLDREVRKRWDAACDKHERNLQDHLAWLDRTSFA